MARQARGALPGVPHLVTQRVQEGQSLARDDVDYQLLLDVLRSASRENRVAVHAYALCPQDWWLLVTPTTENGLSLMVQSLGRRYVAAFNRRHGRQGSLWAGRYRSCVIASAQDLLDCMVLVESPHQTERVGPATSLTWSSAMHHLGLRQDPLVAEHAQFWTLGNTPFDRDAAWKLRLEAGLASDRKRQLAESVNKGWALGSPEDVLRLQQQTDRRLQPGRRGRPPKREDGAQNA